MYKSQKEPVISALSMESGELSRQVGFLSARIATAETEIDAQRNGLAQTIAELNAHSAQCTETEKNLEKELEVLREDLKVVKLIVTTADSECKTQSLLLQQCVDNQGAAVFRTENGKISRRISLLKSA